jgi:hypothetical protein
MVLNKDACFYYVPTLDVTTQVIAQMDKDFKPDMKKAPAPMAEPTKK